MNSVTDIERKLHDILLRHGLVDAKMTWHLQTGGRTNKVWRLSGDEDLICKLYLDASANPLYANTPRAEYDCLVALRGAGVAPDPRGFVETPFGLVLLYHFIEGDVWDQGVTAVAELMSRVHQQPAPEGLRVLSGTSCDVRAQGMDILDKVKTDQASDLAQLCPAIEAPSGASVLIHTDVVPGNLIYSPNGLRLIDWQCPALGDPVVDVAMFLSPAMHLIYGKRVLEASERQAFLNALDPALRARYALVGELYHWRMAAYCLWRDGQGQGGYEQAAVAEMALLKQT